MLGSTVTHRLRGGAGGLSSDSLDFGADFGGFDGPPKQPPRILTYLGITSVVLGILVGAYGVRVSLAGSTNSTQYLIGAIGYLLTSVIPIILLQVARTKHAAALRNNKEVSYDIYAGSKQQSLFLKIVALGLLSAALSIFTLFLPVAEKFAP